MRLGRFKVSGYLVRLSSESLIQIQEGMGVIKVEFDHTIDVAIIYAIGPMFDELKAGEIVPFYDCNKIDVTMSWHEIPTYTYEFVRSDIIW